MHDAEKHKSAVANEIRPYQKENGIDSQQERACRTMSSDQVRNGVPDNLLNDARRIREREKQTQHQEPSADLRRNYGVCSRCLDSERVHALPMRNIVAASGSQLT